MKRKKFTELYRTIEDELLAYILVQGVPSFEADDVLSEASMVLWKKFDSYEEGSNFRAWAYAIVRFEILKQRRALRKRMLPLDENLVEELEAEHQCEVEDHRSGRLKRCLAQLAKKSAELVELRYEENLKPEAIAKRLKRPASSVYASLSRIRRNLKECMEKKALT